MESQFKIVFSLGMPVEKLNYEWDRNSIPFSFSGESAGTEGPQVHVRGRAEDKELGHSLARGGALEDAPAGVAGSHHQARHLGGRLLLLTLTVTTPGH